MQQQNLSVEPLPQFTSHQEGSAPSSIQQPLCGAFDPTTGFLLVGAASGTVSSIHLGRCGSVARRLLGRHAGRVTSACVLPWRPSAAAAAKSSGRPASFFATCSADATIKLWTSDAKAQHTTDPCLQTLRGHTAAITSLAAAQVAHTWCLLSGGADGQLLLWKAVSATESTGQQLSGADMLAQLVPHMQLSEAPLYTSPHWVLSIACALQQTGAGAMQGCFLARAQQPVLQVPISCSAVTDTAAGGAACLAASAQAMPQQQQQQQRPSSPAGSRAGTQAGSRIMGGVLQPSRIGVEASSTFCAATRHIGTLCASSSGQQRQQQQLGTAAGSAAGATTAARSYCRSTTGCGSPSSTAVPQCQQRPGSAGSCQSSSCFSSSFSPVNGMHDAGVPAVSELPKTSHISIFAVKFVPQQMAVLTLAYDGACRLHSVVEGLSRCCWRSPTGSSYVAVDVCSTGATGQVVLLGDDTGSLHLYSLANEKLLATKQVASSRITAVVSCDTRTSLHSMEDGSSSEADAAGTDTAREDCSTGSTKGSCGGSSKGGSCVQFAVLSEDSVGLWQLRQGFSHGIVPGGHRQGVITLQLCCNGLQTADHPQTAQASNSSAMVAPCSSSSSNGMLVSAGLDGRVIEWDLSGTSPAAVQSLLASAGAEGRSEMTAMTYLENSCIAATGHDNGQVLLWHIDTGSHAVLGPQGHSNSVSCFAPALTAKGDEHLLSGGFDGYVCLWEPRQVRGVKPHLITRWQAHGCPALHITQHGQQHLLPHQVMPTQQLQQRQQQQQPQQRPMSACKATSRPVSSSNSNRPLSSHSTAAARSSLSTATRLAAAATAACKEPERRPTSSNKQQGQHSPQAAAAAASSSTHAVGATACTSSCGSLLQSLQQECPPEVLVVLFEPINQVVLSAGNDAVIEVWSSSASGMLLGEHKGHAGPVLCMVLDGNLLLSGSQDGTIRVWDVLPPWFNGRPTTAAMAGSGSSSGSSDGGRQQQQQQCRSNDSSSCHVASDTALMVLRGHDGPVTGLAVAAESGVLVSCGADGEVLQWDVCTGQQLSKCCLDGQVPACVAVEPDTRRVYVGTSQGQLLTMAGTEQVCAAQHS